MKAKCLPDVGQAGSLRGGWLPPLSGSHLITRLPHKAAPYLLNRSPQSSVRAAITVFGSRYTAPAAYTFGNASRTDAAVRGPGIANYDFSLVKKTSFRERYSLEFRAEIFNLFNRVQFGRPNTAQTVSANNTFGVITTQANGPRLIQMAMHLRF
jgi:hypothetical protein